MSDFNLKPGLRYSKSDIRYLLSDPNVNLANPGSVKPIGSSTFNYWLKKKGKSLYQRLGITEADYKSRKLFNDTQVTIILSEFL